MLVRGSRRAQLASLLVALLVVVLPFPAAGESTTDDPGANLLRQGRSLLEHKRPQEALDAFARANRRAGGESVPALLGMAQAQLALERYGQAAAAARHVLALCEGHGEASSEAAAHASNVLGIALYQHWNLGLDDASWEAVERRALHPRKKLPDPPGEEVLEEAAQAFARTLELAGDEANAVRYNLGVVLTELGRQEEAKAVLGEYFEHGGTGEVARHLLCALEPVAEGNEGKEEAPRSIGGTVTRPEKIAGLNPIYPAIARALGWGGIVIIEAIIDERGLVRCSRALKRQPLGLTDAALAAVRGWRFEPARLDGKPVRVYYTLTVNFSVGR